MAQVFAHRAQPDITALSNQQRLLSAKVVGTQQHLPGNALFALKVLTVSRAPPNPPYVDQVLTVSFNGVYVRLAPPAINVLKEHTILKCVMGALSVLQDQVFTLFVRRVSTVQRVAQKH